jgi:coenzyme Q-binding protein COQ10
MPQLSFERHVRQSSAELMSLVSDVRSYPGFVPNCTAMSVRDKPGAKTPIRLATMTARLGPFTQTYTSEVRTDADAGTISVNAIDGPFSHLNSQWRFTPEGEGTMIRFEIDFAFNNPMIAAVAGPAFAAKQAEIMDAFLSEAARRFG